MKRKIISLIFFAAMNSLMAQQDDWPEKTSCVFLNDQNNPGTVDHQREYFEIWNQPYKVITPEMKMQTWQQINSLPGDNVTSTNSWILWGPSGTLNYGGSQYFSGCITDVEVQGTPSVRVAAESGGLWGSVFLLPVQLSDNLGATLNIGSFDSKPNDANTILVGTGTPFTGLDGAGLFRTTNAGASYTPMPMSPNPAGFFRVRYAPGNSNIVHAATNYGYYRSTDGGSTWTRIQLTANVTDLAINPGNNNTIYAPMWGTGLYKTTNGGLNWTLLSGGLPASNFGFARVSVSASNPNVVYLVAARSDNSFTLGAWKSTNAGSIWTAITPVPEFHNGQGFRNSLCGCSPTDPNLVLVGGQTMYRSTNGGSSWTQITTVHPDLTSVEWNSAGTSVWVGCDGGMYNSNDAGATFTSNVNRFPITQFMIFDVNSAGTYCYAGTQDNGIQGTTNRGSTWNMYYYGDGGGGAIDPNNPNWIAATTGAFPLPWAFRRVLTTNAGVSWNFIDNGIESSDQWYHKIRSDKVSPVWLYNNSGPFVYRSDNYGTLWYKLNSTAFPAINILDMSVLQYTTGSSVVYACLYNSPVTSNKLRVYDGGTWYERSTGFPSLNLVRHVTPSPTNNNIAYALINGYSAGKKIFKTTNRGQTWTNISGNLPDVPLSDIVVHPTDNNKLYLGSQYGCYKTTDGGTTWARWTNGMHGATWVTEMGYIDSLASNGRYYVVAATYGRSIYIREISGDDPNGISGHNLNVPEIFALYQNYPNPFNPATKIMFDMPVRDFVTLMVFDLEGRFVKTLVEEELSAGKQEIRFDGSDLASGIYFYRLVTGKFMETRKMMLVK